MLRPNKKARRIAKRVMQLSQQYGDDLEMMDVQEIAQKSSPSRKRNDVEEIESVSEKIGF